MTKTDENYIDRINRVIRLQEYVGENTCPGNQCEAISFSMIYIDRLVHKASKSALEDSIWEPSGRDKEADYQACNEARNKFKKDYAKWI